MAIQVTCPTCHSLLKTPESSAGKRAKCPKCSGVVEIPALAAVPADEDEYELEAPAPPPPGHFTDDELAAPPADQARRPCPECGEMISLKAVKCRFCGELLDKSMRGAISGSGDLSDPGWRSVRGGVNMLYYSITVMVATVILGGIAVVALGAPAFAAGPRGGVDFPPAAAVALLIVGLVVIVAGLAALAGQIRCLAVPEASGARGYALGAVAIIVINVLIGIAAGVTQSEPLDKLNNYVALAGVVLVVLFIKRSASYLGDQDLATSAGRFLVFGGVMFVMMIFVVAVALAGGGPGAARMFAGLIAIAVLIGALVGLVWYLRLLKSLVRAIDERTGAT